MYVFDHCCKCFKHLHIKTSVSSIVTITVNDVANVYYFRSAMTIIGFRFTNKEIILSANNYSQTCARERRHELITFFLNYIIQTMYESISLN